MFSILFLKPDDTADPPVPFDEVSGKQLIVAVLDFETQNVNRAEADALVQSLRYNLDRAGRLIVVEKYEVDAVTSRGGPTEPAAIGRMLGADLVVASTISLDGRDCRVVSSVIRVSDGATVGEESTEARGVDGIHGRPIRELAFNIARIIRGR